MILEGAGESLLQGHDATNTDKHLPVRLKDRQGSQPAGRGSLLARPGPPAVLGIYAKRPVR